MLKTPITVTLESSFPYELKREDFEVTLIKQGNDTLTKEVRVVTVNDTEKSFMMMFGGAYSGIYDVKIRHKQFGLIQTTNQVLTVESRVLSVTPRTASIFGGTILTITGTNFGNEKTDNPV